MFNVLTGYSTHKEYHQLLVSPVNTRKKIIELIEREVSLHQRDGSGRIVMKMNALVDGRTIRALYRASSAGVKIDLIVRGICCLKPEIPGISEHIRVISVIGRFLEHSRVYYFHNSGNEELYLGSADLMPRNLDHRVETLFPVLDKSIIRMVKSDFELILLDNVKAWQMHADGTYSKVENQQPEINSQKLFLERASQKKSSYQFNV